MRSVRFFQSVDDQVTAVPVCGLCGNMIDVLMPGDVLIFFFVRNRI